MTKPAINLLFCGHDQKFINPFIERCQSQKAYNVRVLEHKGHVIQDEAAADKALEWADVIFCEWALGNAAWFSHRKKPHQTLIVRLHLQEVQARDRINFIWEIDWTRVDRLILITHYVYDWMLSTFSTLASKCVLIYNPIPAKRLFDSPKADDSRFVLGFVGIIPARKRLDLAVAILKQLRVRDSRYVLRVKGAMPSDYPWMAQRRDEMAWYDSVFAEIKDLKSAGAVIFDPHGPDMAEWYSGIGHIVSVSDFEGSHQAVAEGMASGCVPAIRDWEGATRIYPARFVGATVESLTELILKNSSTLSLFQQESLSCRSFAQDRFDENDVCDRLEGIIHQEILKNGHSLVRERSGKFERMTLPTVAIVAYIPVGSAGGYRIRVEQEIQIFRQLGCNVHLICLIPKPKDDSRVSVSYQAQAHCHVESLERFGAQVHLLAVEDFFRLDASRSPFTDTINDIIDVVDRTGSEVLHAEALYCARICDGVKKLRPNLTFSIDWHGVTPEEAKMGGAHQSRVAMLERTERHLLTSSDLNIVVSRAMVTHYKNKYDARDDGWVLVPCCVSDQKFTDIGQIPDGHVDSTELTFGYAGTMADWQCGLEMIKLFASLRAQDSRCRFILLAPEGDHPKVLDYVKRTNLPLDSFELRSVAHAEVAQWLQKADVALLLRRDDPVNKVSSPTKYGEYLAASIPVLMTDCIGDFSEHARQCGVGMVLPASTLDGASFDSDLLSAIICFAEGTKTEKLSLRKKCQDSIREDLAWENVARQWIMQYGAVQAQH